MMNRNESHGGSKREMADREAREKAPVNGDRAVLRQLVENMPAQPGGSMRKMREWMYWRKLSSAAALDPPDFTAVPDALLMEATNACNLRCPVCSTRTMKRKTGMMEFEVFKRVIDSFKSRDKKPRIDFDFAGEPLLNAELPRFIRYATENGHFTFVSTNATQLTPKLSEELILSWLGKIHLCIDGTTKEAHEAYRAGSDFEQVKTNIEKFAEIRKAMNVRRPQMVIQTLMTSQTEKQLDDIEAWARKIGADAVNYKTISLGSHLSPEVRKQYGYLLPKNKTLRREKGGARKHLCHTVKSQWVVYWNGDIGLCCIDYNGVDKIGNVMDGDPWEILTSEKAVEARKKGFRRGYPLCRTCLLASADYMGDAIRIIK